jgi:hypothetical protein
MATCEVFTRMNAWVMSRPGKVPRALAGRWKVAGFSDDGWPLILPRAV